MNLCPRKSVGAVITDDQGRYLCLYRLGKTANDPTKGLAFVAGHLDFIDETKRILENPKIALKRESREEIGIAIKQARPVVNAIFPNPCGRGYNGHEWWVYWVTSYDYEPVNLEPSKHAWVKFLTIDEIKDYVARGDCDPAWSKYIWPALGLI